MKPDKLTVHDLFQRDRRHVVSSRQRSCVWNLALVLIVFSSGAAARSVPKPLPSQNCYFALEKEKEKADEIIAACSALIRTKGLSSKPLADAYNSRGIAYASKGQLDLAIADYTDAIAANPSDDTPFNNRGAIFLLKGDFDKAIADFSEVLKLDKTFISAYWNRGNAFAGKKDYLHAISDYNEVLRIDPTGGIFGYGAYMGLGHSYVAMGDLKKAISIYTEAIGKVLSPAGFFLERGLVYRQMSDTPQMLADYNEAVRRNPALAVGGPYDAGISDQSSIDLRYALAFKVFGNSFLEENNNDAAIELYDEAIKLYPEYAAAINNRGVALLNKAEYASALVEFNSATKFSPKFAIAYNNRGNAYFKLGRLDEAMADYTTALSLNPKLATALYPLALIEMMNGNKTAAMRDRAAAIALDSQIENKFADYKLK